VIINSLAFFRLDQGAVSYTVYMQRVFTILRQQPDVPTGSEEFYELPRLITGFEVIGEERQVLDKPISGQGWIGRP